MARRSFWTRAKHRVGLERPHFWEPSAAQKNREVAPARNARRVTMFCPRLLTADERKQEMSSGDQLLKIEVCLILGVLQS